MKFSKPMFRAFLFLSLLMLMTTAMQYVRLDTSLLTKITTLFLTITNAAFIIKMLDIFCRKKFLIGDNEIVITNFTTWGYLWRGYASLYAIIPVWMIINLIVPLNMPSANDYNFLTLIVYEPLFLLCFTLSIWIFFSSYKVEKVKIIVRALRGY